MGGPLLGSLLQKPYYVGVYVEALGFWKPQYLPYGHNSWALVT